MNRLLAKMSFVVGLAFLAPVVEAQDQVPSPKLGAPSEPRLADGQVYSTPDIFEGRDISTYCTAGPVITRSFFDALAGKCDDRERDSARRFVRECWRRKRRGYLIINSEEWAEYASRPKQRFWPTTLHIFIEPDRRGSWQVVWKQVNHVSVVTETIVFAKVSAETRRGEICAGERVKPYRVLVFSGQTSTRRWL